MVMQADMTASGTDMPTAFRVFVAGSDAGAPAPLADLQMLGPWLEAETGRALVVYAAPPACLAARLAQGTTLREAQARWSAEATACMAIQRRHRDRVAMIAAPQDDKALETTREALKERWPGLTLPAGLMAVAAPMGDPAASPALCALSLALDPDAAELMDAIQAATTGPAPAPDGPRKLINSLAGELRASGSGPQRELLEQQLIDAEGQKAALEQQVTDAERQTAVLIQQVTDLEQALREAADETAKTRQDGQARLDEVYASTSWRVTGPMRALKTRLTRR